MWIGDVELLDMDLELLDMDLLAMLRHETVQGLRLPRGRDHAVTGCQRLRDDLAAQPPRRTGHKEHQPHAFDPFNNVCAVDGGKWRTDANALQRNAMRRSWPVTSLFA
jgi:hypothetical protein